MGARRRIGAVTAAVAACALLAAACGRSANSAGSSTAGNISPTKGLVAATPAGTKTVPSVVWAVYRDVNSLDPIYAFDYPENTADSLMCESLLRQAPNGAVQPGLATVANPSPTTMVFTLRPGVKFWDGHTVTPADVVYSLDRNTDPALGGFYPLVFNRVKSIAATGSSQVTITLKQPDYWLEGELASMPGIIIEKSFAQKEGKNYGTPAGSIMCTGAYMLKSWNPGVGVVAVAQPALLEPLGASADRPDHDQGRPGHLVLHLGHADRGDPGVVLLRGVHPGSAEEQQQRHGVAGPRLVNRRLHHLQLQRCAGQSQGARGTVDGAEPAGHHQLGLPGCGADAALAVQPGHVRVRQAVFNAAYDSSPVLTQNIAEAKKLVQQAGATGKTFTIGTTSQVSNLAAVTGDYEAAAQAIGLKVVLKSVSAQNFINFFTDPKARAGIDGFPTVNYGDYADPAALLSTLVLPGGSQNYTNFNDPQITAALEQARSTANLNQRAALVAKAEKLTMQQLPWIPNVQPTSLLLLGKGLTGAVASFAYMFAPWANSLGGSG